MNKITSTGLSEPQEVDFGQIYIKENDYYIVAATHIDEYLLINLSDGGYWTSPKLKSDLIKELMKEGFKKFTGHLNIEVK